MTSIRSNKEAISIATQITIAAISNSSNGLTINAQSGTEAGKFFESVLTEIERTVDGKFQ